jgi:outer membrane lipoprotein-sorting protein
MIKNNLQMARDDSAAVIKFNGEEDLEGVPTLGFTGEFGSGREYYCKRVIINLAKENYLPVKISVFGEAGRLLESYHFTDVRLNAGLKESDFLRDNPEYEFKKRKVYALD